MEHSSDMQISNDVESKIIPKDTQFNLEGQPKTISTISNIEQVKDSDHKMFAANPENEGNESDALNNSSVVENNAHNEDDIKTLNDVQNQSQDNLIQKNEFNKDGNEKSVENSEVGVKGEIDREMKKELDKDIKETSTESHEDVPNDHLNDKSTKDVTITQQNQREDKVVHSIEDKSLVLENNGNNEDAIKSVTKDIENQSNDVKLINEGTKHEINVKDTSETNDRNKDENENNNVEIKEKSVRSEIESELKKELDKDIKETSTESHEAVQSDNLNDKSTKDVTDIQLQNISEDVKDEERNINNEKFDSKLDAEIIKDSNSQLILNDESTNYSSLNTELKQSQNISENDETKINLDTLELKLEKPIDKVAIKDTNSQLNQEILNDNETNKIPIADSLGTVVKETQNIIDKENASSSELIQDVDDEENKDTIITKSQLNELAMPLNAEIKELDNISEKVVDAENIGIFKNETNETDIKDKSTEELIEQSLDKATNLNQLQREVKGLENIPEEVVNESELKSQLDQEINKEKNSEFSSNSTGNSLEDSQNDKTTIAEMKAVENDTVDEKVLTEKHSLNKENDVNESSESSKIFKTETNNSIDEPPNKSDLDTNSSNSVELRTSDINIKIQEQETISNKVEIDNSKIAQNELNKLDMETNNETNSEIVKNELNETLGTDKEQNEIKDKELENKPKTLKDEEKFESDYNSETVKDAIKYDESINNSETVEGKEKFDKMETDVDSNQLKDEVKYDESESKSKTVNFDEKYKQSEYKSEPEIVKNEMNETMVTDVDPNEIKDKESENKSITLKDEEKCDELEYKSDAVKDEKKFEESKNISETMKEEEKCDKTETKVDSNQVKDEVKCDESENKSKAVNDEESEYKSETIKDEKKFDESKNNSETVKDVLKLSNEIDVNTKSSSDLIGADKETTKQGNIPDNDEIEEIIVKNKIFNNELKNENTNKSNLEVNNDKDELLNEFSKTDSLKNENEKVEDISDKDGNEEVSDKTELSETNNVINKSNLETSKETIHVNSEVLDKTSKHNINIKDNTINESIENTLNTENKNREIIADNVDVKSENQKNDTNASGIELELILK